MPYQSYTLAQLQTELGAKYDAAPFWSSAEATSGLNEVLRYWNFFTGMWKNKIMIPMTNPASPWLALPGSLVFGTRVATSGGFVHPGSVNDLDKGQFNWENETVASGGNVPSRVWIWAPVGLTMIALWPTPLAGDQVLVDGIAATPILTLPGDFIDLPTEELGTYLGMVLHTLALKEGGTRWQATSPYRKSFYQAAAKKNARLTGSKIFKGIMGVDSGRFSQPMSSPPEGTPESLAVSGGQE